MRAAILGGSFNPVHLGHLYLADAALNAFHYDRVLFFPANISPFKQHAPDCAGRPAGNPLEYADAADRLDMLLASMPADPRFAVDDMELKRQGVSYTIDTINELCGKYSLDEKPALLLGDDLAADFDKWKSAAEIAQKADIILARRGNPALNFPFPHKTLKNEVMAVSSRQIRSFIASGGPWRYLVPSGARTIIEERGLYGVSLLLQNRDAGKSECSPELLDAVEGAARRALSSERFLHSRGAALMARDLALRFGLDPGEAYLAGIAHDLGRSLGRKKLLALVERDGMPVSALERKKPGLLHGRAAAVLLRERFKLHNKRVLEAVALHTSGAAGMGPLAMAVFIADKIEYSREARRGVPALRETAVKPDGPSLPSLLLAVLEDTRAYLDEQKLEILDATAALLEDLKKRELT
ncbi:MAG: nicotinate (nicotinamide) nucleotide adenylyltransferase [Treponema sp.]|nr:nicotinate (nicotinamide) nucleotide adenylyltransferase [Treponema sp.]